MNLALPNPLKVAAAASLASSCALVAVPFAFDNLATVGAVAFVNWCLFMATSYFAFLPLPKWGTFSAVEQGKLKLWLIVFLAFTIASWAAFALVNE